MSFFGDLFGNIAGSLARTAITGYVLNRLNRTVNNPTTQQQPDPGVRVTSNADTEKKIPVVYGNAVVGGILTDAYLTSDNKTMYFCLALSEQTGNLDLGQGDPSQFSVKGVYWNDNKLIFNDDGITVQYTEDRDGNTDETVNGLIKVWCFAGNSESPVVPQGYTNTSLVPAYSIMPNWDISWYMSDLVFAIIRMDYSSGSKITSFGNWKFRLQNTMYKPGDVLFDYATNGQYGAGLPPTEIYAS